MIRKFAVLSMALLLAGCGTVSTPPPLPVSAPVTGIAGMGQFPMSDGRFATCAGYSVVLMAETPKTRERMVALYGAAEHAIEPIAVVKARSAGLPAGDPPLNSAQCDSAGAFAFPDLEPGAYYLIVHLKVAPVGKGPDDLVMLQRVGVRPGAMRDVRLAP